MESSPVQTFQAVGPGGLSVTCDERLLGSILDICADYVAAVDREFRFIAFNRTLSEEFARVYGVHLAIGDTVSAAMASAPQDLAKFLDPWARALAGEEFTVVRQFGTPLVAYELRFSGLRDDTGTVTTAFHTGRRISAGLQPDEQFRTLAENIPQLCWMADADGWIFWYNRRWYEYTGTTPEQMQGWGWESVHDPAMLPSVIERWQRSIASGEPFDMVFPLRGADGVFRPFLTRIMPVRDSAGRVARWFGTNTDISEERRIQQALEASEERYRLLSETAPVLVWTCGADGRCDFLNSRWVAYTGVPAERHLGYGWLEQVNPEDLARVREAWQRSVAGGAPFDLEYRLRAADGQYRWFKTRARPMRDPSGQIVRWFGTNTDVHDLKTTEQALRRANDNLEQFAYIAAHDLQEPLRTVVTFSQLAERKAGAQLEAEARQCLAYVIGAAQRMSDLIRDVLAYSRANSGNGYIRAEVDLGAVVRSTVQMLAARIDESAAEIVCDPLPVVHAEPAGIKQVFYNLVGNALKYRRRDIPCRIHIGAQRASEEWVIAVRDNGMGFRQEYAEQIFGIFKRLHGNDIPGSGIGLAICKAIVERHGGRIWAESEENSGTTISFTVRATEQPA